MSEIDMIKKILVDVLQINGEEAHLDETTSLLGGIPEFDSMAVVGVVTALEDNYGFIVDDDEIEAETFETIGSLVRFVEDKLAE